VQPVPARHDRARPRRRSERGLDGAFQPVPGQAAYGAGKAFVLSYTHSLAAELRGSGVTATALCPGPVHTRFGATAGFARNEAETALPSFMWSAR